MTASKFNLWYGRSLWGMIVRDDLMALDYLQSQPGVDPKRIGVTGISWGGYLTSIVSSLDHRFRFGTPVYGCGFLSEDSAWLKNFAQLGPDRTAKWVRLWDPKSYLPLGRIPMFWINGTNDFAYVPPSWQSSYRLPRGRRMLSFQVRMKHSHPDGAKPAEIFAYAKAALQSGIPLVRILRQGVTREEAWAVYHRRVAPQQAEICFTTDTGKWQDRNWRTLPASIDPRTHHVSARIPNGARVYFLTLADARGLIVSTEHQERWHFSTPHHLALPVSRVGHVRRLRRSH
jgi:hypothetical protein